MEIILRFLRMLATLCIPNWMLQECLSMCPTTCDPIETPTVRDEELESVSIRPEPPSPISEHSEMWLHDFTDLLVEE